MVKYCLIQLNPGVSGASPSFHSSGPSAEAGQIPQGARGADRVSLRKCWARLISTQAVQLCLMSSGDTCFPEFLLFSLIFSFQYCRIIVHLSMILAALT